jgi:hypothetical protein
MSSRASTADANIAELDFAAPEFDSPDFRPSVSMRLPKRYPPISRFLYLKFCEFWAVREVPDKKLIGVTMIQTKVVR